jgi:tetratricopeptide (TPR) repeat protein
LLNTWVSLRTARRIYRLGLPVQPASPEAHYNLALELRQKGRLEEAIAEYRTAIELKPDFQVAHNNLKAANRCVTVFGASFQRVNNAA